MSQTSATPAKIIFQALKQFPFYSHLFPAQRAFLSLEAVSKPVFDIMLMKEFFKKIKHIPFKGKVQYSKLLEKELGCVKSNWSLWCRAQVFLNAYVVTSLLVWD